MIFSTLYQHVDQTLVDAIKEIKLIAFDVDGVFSNGHIIMSNAGEELKQFHTLDGYGVKAIIKAGIKVAVITGRQSNIVQHRMQSLGVTHIVQNCEGKYDALSSLARSHGYSSEQIASVGDDMPDLGMFDASQVCFSVANGHPLVKQAAHYVTLAQGGNGAVREICDLFLDTKGVLNVQHGRSL